MNRAKLITALAGTAIVSFGIGLWTPRLIEIYSHKQDLSRIAKHCNDLADKLGSGERRTALFRECFGQNVDALAQANETSAVQKAGDMARKLD
ncbi:hypothetical protein [Burkholderia gladioli]|uniref:hypothetical protein n=1 Tax=Burkholderia gladioli TaxID=28095 RepID=UPI00163EFA54|nr:hypothetical protein [Burkholderia gladioli]